MFNSVKERAFIGCYFFWQRAEMCVMFAHRQFFANPKLVLSNLQFYCYLIMSVRNASCCAWNQKQQNKTEMEPSEVICQK